MVYRVVTRTSKLALRQAELFLKAMHAVDPTFDAVIMPMASAADKSSAPISTFGGKSSFVKDLDDAVLSGFADCAVHSLKDMSVENVEGLTLAAVMQREDPRDVLISRQVNSLQALPSGALIGTSSLRRAAQLSVKRPDLKVLPCRGNIQTRLAKLDRGDFDALILAGAGFERLGLQEDITEYLSPDWMLPAPAQAVIALHCRVEDVALRKRLMQVHDLQTADLVYWERKVVSLLGGHCQMPLAVHASLVDGAISLEVALGYTNGDNLLRKKCLLVGGTIQENLLFVQEFCQDIIQSGGAEILQYYKS